MKIERALLRLFSYWWLIGLLVSAIIAKASPGFNTDDPLDFFTKVANRFLRTLPANYYGDLSVTNIPIYPTNYYTPSVHRLLQLAANLYDATTNRVDLQAQPPYYPHVYRPIFRKESAGGTNQVWIAGYVEVTNDAVAAVNLPCLEAVELATNATFTTGVFSNYNVYNAPWVIGAKKGFPNFNEYFLQSALQVDRKLEFRRKDVNGNPYSPANPVAYTNQLYAFSVSNDLRIVAWNSYSNLYPNTLQWKLELTNELALTYSNELTAAVVTNMFRNGTNIPLTTISSVAWPGFNPNQPWYSFRIPVSNNVAIVPQTNIVFQQSPVAFTSLDPTITRRQQVTGFPLPHWWVNWKTKLRFAMVDNRVNRVVDYVSLSATEDTLDVLGQLASGATHPPCHWDQKLGDGWATNRNNLNSPPEGILNQICVCEDIDDRISKGVWTEDSSVIRAQGGTKTKAIQFFTYNMGLTGGVNVADSAIYKTNIFQAPYTPASIIPKEIYWQANDPLVHYIVTDLTDPAKTNIPAMPIGHFMPILRPLDVTKRYRPWHLGETKYKLEFKDPLVYRSDHWDFPTNKLPNVGWIGRVHRGTPWQTVYLKSTPVGLNDWTNWTGNIAPVPYGRMTIPDAAFSLPANDWHLAGLMASLLNTNDPCFLLSVDNSDTNSWLHVLDGLVALTNTDVFSPQFEQIIISSNSPQAALMANGINRNRSSTNFNGSYRHLGSILSVPELSVNSPFLNLTHGYEPAPFIDDEAYEKLPSQLLSLLRSDFSGSISQYGRTMQVRFTGDDGYSYAIETSTNLLNWTALGTNSPTGGIFQFTEPTPLDSFPRFYRSVLLP